METSCGIVPDAPCAPQHLLFSDHLEIHMIELPKIEGDNRSIESELLINWAEFLSLGNEDELMTLKDRTDLPEAVQKAIEEYERIKDDPNLQMEALNRQIAILDYIQRWDVARAEGLAEGLAEGKAEGIEEGIILVARNFKQQGLDYNAIAKATGLTLEFIEKL
jgi:predicted transposase/invertase (TIGR01784 family)